MAGERFSVRDRVMSESGRFGSPCCQLLGGWDWLQVKEGERRLLQVRADVASELSFTWGCFLAAMFSNVVYATRGVL
eukprot:763914-Hanusia_phi.AAC.3